MAWVEFLPSPKHEACLLSTVVVRKWNEASWFYCFQCTGYYCLEYSVQEHSVIVLSAGRYGWCSLGGLFFSCHVCPKDGRLKTKVSSTPLRSSSCPSRGTWWTLEWSSCTADRKDAVHAERAMAQWPHSTVLQSRSGLIWSEVCRWMMYLLTCVHAGIYWCILVYTGIYQYCNQVSS